MEVRFSRITRAAEVALEVAENIRSRYEEPSLQEPLDFHHMLLYNHASGEYYVMAFERQDATSYNWSAEVRRQRRNALLARQNQSPMITHARATIVQADTMEITWGFFAWAGVLVGRSQDA